MIRVGCFAALVILSSLSNAEDWPQWRGPRGDGTSHEAEVPTTWDGTTGEHIVWKTKIAGSGYSSPIISDGRIFLTSCNEETGERTLHCLGKTAGEMLWTRTVIEAPLEGMHKLNSRASGTPVADGQHVFATFFRTDDATSERGAPGEMMVAAYDYEGNQQWNVTVGAFSSVHGFCTSPVLFEDLVLVNGDHDGESYLAALNKATGDVVWKTPREHRTRSYVTPLLCEVDGKMQAVMSGSKRVAGFDPKTGERLWWIEGPTEQFVASLVDDGKHFYLSAGFPTHHVMAIRPGGFGDVSDTHVAWHVKDAKSYVPSPIVVGNFLFVADDRGIGHCFDTGSGDHLWRKRLGSHFSASLVSANGNVYFTADDGATIVMKAANEPKILHENQLGERVYASPAISDGKLFLRGIDHLFCIGD